ncbi:MAG: hypothetical protein VCA74_05185 [Deltaproteobacteria bacterium]
MKLRSKTPIAVATLIAAALFLTTMAGQATALDKAELKCRGTIAKGFTKLAAAADKVMTICHKLRVKGKAPYASANCNDLTQADAKGKYQKAVGKLTGGIAKKCAGLDNDLLKNYVSCPASCQTEQLSNPLADYTDLGTCLACYAGDVAETRAASVFGSPVASGMSKTDGKCHGAIGKGYGKYVSTILKERTKCQKKADKAGSTDSAGCASVDPKGKIAKALTKATAGIDKSCAGADLATLDSCASTDTAALKACLGGAHAADAVTLYEANYELAATICPVGAEARVRAGANWRTSLDVGWTGVAHNGDITDDYGFTVTTTCPNAFPPCGECSIDGLTPSANAPFVRCKDDPTIRCAVPFTTDPACPSSQECIFMLGPPLALSSGNNPVCVLNALATDITGTANAETGEGAFVVQLMGKTHLGEGLTQPCPICVGDTVPQDDNQDGVCQGGPADGQACDVQAFSATFGDVSLDCPPSPLTNISGNGLALNLNFTTGTAQMGFDNKCDPPLGSYDCACGVCTGDTTVNCVNDGDCAAINAGTCTTFGGGAARLPNQCNDGNCVDIGNEKGVCATAGPVDRFCDGITRTNGSGFIGCQSDFDCEAVDSVCGGDCGTCTLESTRGCFLNPIMAHGQASLENPLMATTFCISPVGNDAINLAAGLPGPARLLLDQQIKRIY